MVAVTRTCTHRGLLKADASYGIGVDITPYARGAL